MKVYIVLYETMYNDNIYSSLYIISLYETMYNINNQFLKSQCIKVSKKFIKKINVLLFYKLHLHLRVFSFN